MLGTMAARGPMHRHRRSGGGVWGGGSASRLQALGLMISALLLLLATRVLLLGSPPKPFPRDTGVSGEEAGGDGDSLLRGRYKVMGHGGGAVHGGLHGGTSSGEQAHAHDSETATVGEAHAQAYQLPSRPARVRAPTPGSSGSTHGTDGYTNTPTGGVVFRGSPLSEAVPQHPPGQATRLDYQGGGRGSVIDGGSEAAGQGGGEAQALQQVQQPPKPPKQPSTGSAALDRFQAMMLKPRGRWAPPWET